jgi:4-amino-4-deoxy-L-arabinose transferase-like glycosyltransferase
MLKTQAIAKNETVFLRSEFIGVLCLLFLLCAVLRLSTLGYPALSDPSEGRYASLGQQMVLSGNWITPQTHNKDGLSIPFLGKPPLHAWLTALSFEFFGMSELTARLPSFLAGVFTCGAMAFFAATFFGAATAYLSLLVLMSSMLFFVLSGGCITDPVLAACTTGSMVCAACALHFPRPALRRYWGYGFFFMLGLGMLTKGPVAIVLPGMAFFLWIALQRKFSDLRALPWVGGVLLFCLVWLPWYLLAEERNPGFLRYFFINENLLRYLVHHYGDRYGTGHEYPFGTIWGMLFLAFLPWTLLPLFLPKCFSILKQASGRYSPWLSFCILWAIMPMLFFTFARQISLPYVMPVLPALAILAAIVIRETAESHDLGRLLIFFKSITAVSAVAAVLFLGFGIYSDEEYQTTVFSFLVILVVVAFVLMILRKRRGFWELAAVSAGSSAALMCVLLLNIDDRLDAAHSAKEVVQFVEAKEPNVTELGFLNKTPHSAYFYASDVDDSLKLKILSEEDMSDTALKYVAVRKKDVKTLDEPNDFHLVEPFGYWVLFEKDASIPQAPGPAEGAAAR